MALRFDNSSQLPHQIDPHGAPWVLHNFSNVTNNSSSASHLARAAFWAKWKWSGRKAPAFSRKRLALEPKLLRAEYHGAVRAYREAVIQLDAGLPGQDFELAYLARGGSTNSLRTKTGRVTTASLRARLSNVNLASVPVGWAIGLSLSCRF
jgi:hypothetical protein